MNDRTFRQLRAIAEADKILLTAEDEQIERINDALNQSFATLHNQLKQKWAKHSTGNTFAQDRALLLIADIKESLNVLDPKSKRTKSIKKQYKELLKLANKTGTSLGDRLLAEYPETPSKISVDSVASLQLDVVAIASQEAYDRLLQHGEKFASDASIVIQQGLIQNWGIAKTARALASTLGTTKVRAEMIARTESAKASTRAAKKRYLEEGVDLVQHIATQDPRVCKYCAARAGKIYPAEIHDPIQHPNCRCYIVPIRREWIEEGLFDAEWAQQHSEKTIAKAGGSNPGPSPFERKSGLTDAPASIDLTSIFNKEYPPHR